MFLSTLVQDSAVAITDFRFLKAFGELRNSDKFL